VVAATSIAYGSKYGDMMMHGGTVLDSSSPVVQAFPAFFEPIEAPTPPPAQPSRRRRNG